MMVAIACFASACDDDDRDQQREDDMVVYAALDTTNFLFNQNLAGHPTGAQDLTVPCPLGGTVHITGTTSADTQTLIDTVDLVYSMQACANVGSGYDLVFSGDIHAQGSFRSTGYKAMTKQSLALTFAGTVDAGATVTVGETCELAINETGEDFGGSSVIGKLCGRTVDF